MSFGRFFVLRVLLISPAAWPAAAHSFPAVSVQHLLADKDCETVPDLLGDWDARGGLSGTWTMQKLGEPKIPACSHFAARITKVTCVE